MRNTILILWVTGSTLAYGDVLLEVENGVGSPGDTCRVQVNLQNPVEVTGVAFELIYDSENLKFIGCIEVASPFEIYVTERERVVHMVFLNPNDSRSLHTGTNKLCTLVFAVKADVSERVVRLEPEQFTYTTGTNLPVEGKGLAEAGEIAITPQTLAVIDALWQGVREAKLTFGLQNLEPISALHFTMGWNGLGVDNVVVKVVGRAGAWDVISNPSRDAISIILADFTGQNPIVSGRGGVFDIHFVFQEEIGELAVEVNHLRAVNNHGQRVYVATRPYKMPLREQDALIDGDVAIDDKNTHEDIPSEPGAGVGGDGISNTIDPADLMVSIDEFLADPPPGMAGDVNQDGVRNSREDEFVELVNTGQDIVDISGWGLSDDDVSRAGRFVFPPGTILRPNNRVVVFGGGKPQGISGKVFVDDGSFGNGLTNTGDTILLIHANGDTLESLTFGHEGNLNQSLNKKSNGLVLHMDTSRRDPFSPGKPMPEFDLALVLPVEREVVVGETTSLGAYEKFTDGLEKPILSGDVYWISGQPDIIEMQQNGIFRALKEGVCDVWFAYLGKESLHATIQVIPAPSKTETTFDVGGMVITEVHPDPGLGPVGDTNGDGIRDTYADEFVELQNRGETPVDLSGWYLGDDGAIETLFRFPDSTIVDPGEFVVLFGGGIPQGIAGQVFVDDGRIGDGLSNSGDQIRLVAPGGIQDVLICDFSAGDKGVSWSLSDEMVFVGHDVLPGRDHFSPGKKQPKLVNVRILPERNEARVGDTVFVKVMGVFDDGKILEFVDQVNWLVLPHESDLGGGRLSANLAVDVRVRAIWGDFESKEHILHFRSTDTSEGNADNGMENTLLPNLPTNRSIELVGRNLMLTEIHANPASDMTGDTNQDGIRETYGDEFLEFTNIGSDTLNLSGWFIGEDGKTVGNAFQFPEGAILLPNAICVVWGNFAGAMELVFSGGGRIGDGLSNSGEKISLFDPVDTSQVITWDYPATKQGVSFVPNASLQWILHNAEQGLGNLSPLSERFVIQDIKAMVSDVDVIVGEPIELKVLGVLASGQEMDMRDLVLWEGDLEEAQMAGQEVVFQRAGTWQIWPRWGDLKGNTIRFSVGVAEGTDSLHTEDPFKESEEDSLVVKVRDSPHNSLPQWANKPDSNAIANLTYKFDPKVYDADGDSICIAVKEAPDWLMLRENSVSGLVPTECVDFALILLATDGRDTTTLQVKVKVFDPNLQLDLAIPKVLFANTSFSVHLPHNDAFGFQANGVWQIRPTQTGFELEPQEYGLLDLQLALLDQEQVYYVNRQVFVQEFPILDVVEVEKQHLNPQGISLRIVLYNMGNDSLDLSDCLLFTGISTKDNRLQAGAIIEAKRHLEQVILLRKLETDVSLTGKDLLLLAPNGRDTLLHKKMPDLSESSRWMSENGAWLPASSSPIPSELANGNQIADTSIGITSEQEEGKKAPFFTHKPKPNPFRSQTYLNYYTRGDFLTLTVYTIQGQRVRSLVNGFLPTGYYESSWDGTDDWGSEMGSGVYLIRYATSNVAYTYSVALLR